MPIPPKIGHNSSTTIWVILLTEKPTATTKTVFSLAGVPDPTGAADCLGPQHTRDSCHCAENRTTTFWRFDKSTDFGFNRPCLRCYSDLLWQPPFGSKEIGGNSFDSWCKRNTGRLTVEEYPLYSILQWRVVRKRLRLRNVRSLRYEPFGNYKPTSRKCCPLGGLSLNGGSSHHTKLRTCVENKTDFCVT